MSTALSKDQEVTVTIASLAHGGSGVGRVDDFVVFVPFTAPGDTVRARITHLKKNYADGELLEILTPGPERATPPCPVFGECGGCQWQHVHYAEQLKQKQLIVEHALNRIAKEEAVTILPILASPDAYHYRNRAHFRTEGPKVGFFRRGSHDLVEFEKCLIVEDAINGELAKIKTECAPNPDYRTSKIEVFISGTEGKVFRSVNKGTGEELGFSQVNTKQNVNMVSYVQKCVEKPAKVDLDNLGSRGNLLELYCGNGNFSFPLNRQGWRIYGVDLSRPAISAARKTATPTTFFSAADCSIEVKRLAEKKRQFEVVLLDPPRIGADERLWANLVKLNPDKIIYVSCNPTTFARDWARLKAKGDYRLVTVQPVDMFLQTFHVELVATIEKKK